MDSTSEFGIDVRDTAGAAFRLPVRGQHFLIGRTAEAQIRLDRATVSRRHAEILRDPFGRWWVRDLGSRNGLAVNGVRCTEKTVGPGDVITVGEFFLTLNLPPAAGTHAAPPSTPVQEGSTATRVTVREERHAALTGLQGAESPRLAALHLSKVTELGQRLLNLPDAAGRLSGLCELMVSPELHGRSAVVLRLPKSDLREAPEMLCPVAANQAYSGWEPYISRSFLQALLTRNEPLLASNTHPNGSAAAGMELSLAPDVATLATVACPLASTSRAMDVLYVILPPEFGTTEWLALAVLAARQYQQAETTWSGRKLGEEHAAIERELDQARQIQLRLVPRNIVVPGLECAIGFKPCKWVGGDYVDVVPTPEHRTVLTVADVCGKGLPAALVAASLHTMVHTSIRAGLPLPDLMRNLNEYLCETLAPGSFVTMCALEVEAQTGRFEVINAGHPPALVLTGGGDVRELQKEANMPLGLDAKTPVAESGELKTGQILALFSDGLTELPTASGDLLGEDALARHLRELCRATPMRPASDLAAALTQILDDVQGDRLSSDDRTFLLARRVIN